MRKSFHELLFTVLVLTVCGCICGLGTDESSAPTTTEPYCTPPYIQVGRECCLDGNRNGICDTEEATTTLAAEPTATHAPAKTTLAPTTTKPVPGITLPATLPTTTTTTTIGPTTTTGAPSCSDGIQNQDEEYVDCGGSCKTTCDVLRVSGSWKEFMGYRFRVEDVKVKNKQTNYYFHIKTPDGLKAEHMYLSTGEGFIDHLRFKVINYPEDMPKVAVGLNVNDLSSIPSDATMLAVGGTSCPTYMTDNIPSEDVDLCCRSYSDYKICLKSRSERKVLIALPDDSVGKLELNHMKDRYLEDLTISGFFDRPHFINGGYILVYVRTRS
jgi:hypothetical protein